MAWTREAASLLIDMYFQRPSLYKTNSPDYYDRSKRQKCLVEIATGLLEVRGPTTEDEVRIKINGLRTQYQSEVNKIETSKRSTASQGVYQPKLWCFNQLQFLRDHITPRKATNHPNYKVNNQGSFHSSSFHSIKEDGAEAEIESSKCNSYLGIQQQEESEDSTTCRRLEMEDFNTAEEEDNSQLNVKRQRTAFDRRDFDNFFHIGQSNVTTNGQRAYEDKYDIFGKYLASELRDITNDSLFLHAKKEILAVLMEYQLKQLEFNKMGLGGECSNGYGRRELPSVGVKVSVVSRPVLLGEGPHWDDVDQALYFVDIKSHSINRLKVSTGEQTQAVIDGTSVGFIVPVRQRPGSFLVAVGLNISEVEWSGEDLEGPLFGCPLTSIDLDKPDNRFNDGKADPSGRLWGGTMGPEPEVGHVVPRQGSLYSFKPMPKGGVVAEMHLTSVDISNGLAWTSDNSTMYYIDTGTDRVDALDFDINTGEISNRRPAFDFTGHNITGHPDGMTIDSDGNLWVACFGGSQVIYVDPREDELLGRIAIPAERVTSVAFGGPDLDVIYVTTSRFGLTPEELAKQPNAGSVFAVTGLGIKGLPGQSTASLI